MKRNIFLKILAIILIITVMVASWRLIDNMQEFDFEIIVSTSLQNIAERMKNVTPISENGTITSVDFINNADESNLIGRMITIDGLPAFILNESAINVNVGDELEFDTYASDQLMAILISGYPNLSPEDVGLSSEEEFYQATQIALIEVSTRTGETSNNTWEGVMLKTLKSQWGRDVDYKVFAVAKKLIEQAENNPYKEIPTLTIDNKYVHFIKDTENGVILVGKYSFSVNDCSLNAQISVNVTDENGNEIDCRFVDIYENELETIDMNTDFYIEFPIDTTGSYYVNFSGTCDRAVGKIFNSGDKDYIVLDREIVNFDKTLGIKF